jgi:hypothetical protein
MVTWDDTHYVAYENGQNMYGRWALEWTVALNNGGANIRAVNMSYTAGGFGYIFGPGELAVLDDYRTKFVITRAAGNDSSYVGTHAYAPGNAAFNLAHLLIVGSVDSNNQISAISNRPGTGCIGAYPCAAQNKTMNFWVVAPGQNITSAFAPDGYTTWNGSATSASAPIAAGVVALVAEKAPQLSPSQNAEAIRKSATDLGAPGVDADYGWGLVNAPAAVALATTPTLSVMAKLPRPTTMGFVAPLPKTNGRFNLLFARTLLDAPKLTTSTQTESVSLTEVGIAGKLFGLDAMLTRQASQYGGALWRGQIAHRW